MSVVRFLGCLLQSTCKTTAYPNTYTHYTNTRTHGVGSSYVKIKPFLCKIFVNEEFYAAGTF